MFCGLEEERTRFRKKQKGKKKRKIPHRGQNWVGWDERVSKTHKRMKYFLPYLSRF